MEKRALLAFGLIILVWILYYYLLFPLTTPPSAPAPPVPATAPPPTETDTVQRAVSGTDSISSLNRASSPLPVSDSWDRLETLSYFESDSSAFYPAQEILVESDLYRGVINTQGGVITSWKMKRFRGPESEWVELIPSNREYGPDVILTTEQGPVSFYRVFYKANKDTVLLSAEQREDTLELRGSTTSGTQIIKRFSFQNHEYAIKTEIEILNGDRLPLGSKYYLRWGGGLRITEQDLALDLAAFRGFALLGDAVIERDIGRETEPPHPEESGESARWVGVRTKYFLVALSPQNRSGKGIRLNGRPVPGGAIPDRQISAEISMTLSASLQDQFLLYLGPVHYETLEQYGIGLENTVDLGWSVIRPISKIILVMMVWLHQFISNYGLVIVLVSILVKIILFPLTYKSLKATQGMQKLQPRIEALRDKYKNDAQKLNQEMMKIYREAGVNPLGGCLPLLLQMPILYGLYLVFNSTIELRDAPFYWWINDLSLKDPYYILPIVMGLTQLIQSKMTMKDPRQAALVYIMPAVLFFIMKDLPSGLILYWTMINILSIIQQYIQDNFLPQTASA